VKVKKIKTGVIGCGNISAKYLHSLTEVFSTVEVMAVSDIFYEAAVKRGERFNIPHICKTNEELLALSELELVIVLTNPDRHFAVAEASLKAGKHTYIEKPLSLTTEDGKKLVTLAKEKGLMLSGAPDTILGAGIQTVRKLIDDGWIGEPIAAISHILTAGPESWHPNPAFLYHKGAGPLYDVAPYYVAGLGYLFGPVSSVMCSGKKTYDRRSVTSQPFYGTVIDVEVPTFLAGILTMKNGVICTIHHSFDVLHTMLGNSIEIYGTRGVLVAPTPCDFSGKILYRGSGDTGWSTIPMVFPYRSDNRGIGAAEMAEALLQKRPPRLGADFVYHTLDVLEQLDNSLQKQEARKIESGFEKTLPMSMEALWGPDKTWNPADY
jgi:predicted dehydrogenase